MRTVSTLAALAVFLLAPTVAALADLEQLYAFDGDSSDDVLGVSVSGAGDLNGDGYDDIIVGAPEGNYARVYSGMDGKTLYTFKGDASGDDFGISVSGAGDVNRDGVPDVIVGAQFDDDNGTSCGSARVFSGKDGATLYTFYGDSSDDRFGRPVSDAGDVNADGYDDVIVGIYFDDDNGKNCGAARVFSGKDGTTLYTFYGESAYDRLGQSVRGAGDVNGDGYDDVIVGVPRDDETGTDSGSVRVYSGKDGKALYTFHGDSAGDHLGYAVSGAGDVNGDGIPDLVASSPFDDDNATNCGSVRVYSGKDGTVLYTFYGDSADDELGYGRSAVSGAGDVNGDGFDDIIAGARADDDNGSSSGSARIYSGKDGKTLQTFFGGSSDDRFGFCVSTAGDVNGDGDGDVIVGAKHDDDGGSDAGRAFVFACPIPEGTVTINAGADATNMTAVTLSLTWKAAGHTVTDVRIRDKDGSWGSWLTVAATKPWTLPSGEGEKTVEVQYRDSRGAKSLPRESSIVLDQTNPWGTLLIADNVEWVGDRTVDLTLWYADGLSGVEDMRLRDGGGSWGAWHGASTTSSWTLPKGDGEKRVEVQYRDAAGNISETIADLVKLDETPPTVSVVIDGGRQFTGGRVVNLHILADDGDGSGVVDMSLKPGTLPTWLGWLSHREYYDFILSSGDGAKPVDVKVRDLVGHESVVARDSIVLDQTPPVCDRFTINNGRPYVLPAEPLTLEVFARDNIGGSQPADFKASFDGGKTWSDWYDLLTSYTVEVARPGAAGPISARIVVRDLVGNEAKFAEASTYLVESDPPWLGAAAKFAGAISGDFDVDAAVLDLAKGDVLTVKVKVKADVKKTRLDLALDLVRPDGTRLVLGRFPADAPKLGITGWVVPESGRHLLVLHRLPTSEAGGGTYKLTAKVKQAKENKKGKGTFSGTEILFEAGHGSTLKANLKGEGLDLSKVTLEGPDGPVEFTAKEGKGKVTIQPTMLEVGSGTYRIRFTEAITVTAKWRVKLAKVKGTVTN